MYEKLKTLIEDKNKEYQRLNDIVYNFEHIASDDATEEQYNAVLFDRWQFIHNYASSLNDFIWYNKEELTADDLSALDLVPNVVWRKMSAKSEKVVDLIMNLHEQGKK